MRSDRVTAQVAESEPKKVSSSRSRIGAVVYLIAAGLASLGWAWLIAWFGLGMPGF
jgi:hypothetical protein